MSRPKQHDLQKHTLLLFEGDYKKLQDYFPSMGAAMVIRLLVRKKIAQIESQVDTTSEEQKVDVELDI